MKILFLGDVVGLSGCKKITNDLLGQIKKNYSILQFISFKQEKVG